MRSPKSVRYEVSKRGLKPKLKSHRDCRRTEVCFVNQMNRMHTLNFPFNVFHIKVVLMRKLRLAPNQALHVTSCSVWGLTVRRFLAND